MSDKLAAIIGTSGLLGTFTAEKVNVWLGSVVAILTIGILLPKFLSSVQTLIAFVRPGKRQQKPNTTTDTEQ